MARKPGTLAEMPDGRKVIIYDNQPLLKEHGKVIVHLIDDDYNLIMQNGKLKILMFAVHVYNELTSTWKAFGKVD